MMEPLVSVVIPTFNRAGTIERAVRSVLDQSYKNIEVIIVDDGSEDDTVDRLGPLGDGRIRVLSTSGRVGAPSARNMGIAAARGDWVAFQDSDDVWLPDKLILQMDALFKSPGANACYGQLIQLYGDKARIIPSQHGLHTEGDILRALVADSIISTQTLVCRTSLLLGSDGFDPALSRLQDWDLVLRLARRGVQFAFVREALAIAYETPGSLTSFLVKGDKAREAILNKHKDLEERFPVQLARHWFTMASLSAKAGDFAQARRQIGEAKRLAPKNPKYVAFFAFAVLKEVTRWLPSVKR